MGLNHIALRTADPSLQQTIAALTEVSWHEFANFQAAKFEKEKL